jgi:6-phospho-beta-glucosidase
MQAAISAILGAKPDDVYLDYFGLNHLGWIKRIIYQNQDRLPEMIILIKSLGGVPGLPFDADLVVKLGMIPNEYLYYYYYNTQAVTNIFHSNECRGEQVARQNLKLFADLKEKFIINDFAGMQASYQSYLDMRGSTYMVKETGKPHDFSILDPKITKSISDEGYAGVALNLIEALVGDSPKVQILNVSNTGALSDMDEHDVVEIPALVSHDHIQPMVTNDIPQHCLGLIQQVKHYEHLTIEAAVEKSYQKALLALTLHPLVHDFTVGKSILDEYITQHNGYFPFLQ